MSEETERLKVKRALNGLGSNPHTEKEEDCKTCQAQLTIIASRDELMKKRGGGSMDSSSKVSAISVICVCF